MENSTALSEIKSIEAASFPRMKHQDIVRIIKSVNEENKYWEQKEEKRIRPVPNMSGRQYNPDDTYDVTKDYFMKGEFDPSFQKFILTTACRDRIVLYVHEDEFGFAPIFAVFGKDQRFSESISDCLIKFKRSNFSNENFSEFAKLLYSRKNKKKMSQIKKSIEELSFYEY